jgi:biopolymer transport protein ExbD
MKVPTRDRERGVSFNITPLIDIVFLLIIFFLVASYFVRPDQLAAVELPKATTGDFEAESDVRYIITVLPDGSLSVNNSALAVDLIKQQLQQLITQHGPGAIELRIRGDRSVPFAKVEPLLLLAAELGLQQVRFAVSN